LTKRASLIVSFSAILLLAFLMIDAGANPYMDGIAPFGATQHNEVPPSGAAQYSEAPQYDLAEGQIMMASYYGYSHAGNMTASGVPFDPEGFTAAHRTMPFGTQLLVSHGGNSVQVTVNDRGPYVDGIELDLSQAAAETIGLTNLGVAPVEVTVL
jgi:rare lipoprotein A (peptidoglycan hydrolase)